MPQPTNEQLAAEITGDPESLGYAAFVSAGDWNALADRLNATDTGRTKKSPMRMNVFTQFLMSRALLKKIKEGSESLLLPPAVQDVCFGLLLLIQGASDRDVDPTDPATISMIDALVAAKVATADDKAAWLAACTRPCGRASELWGVAVTGDQCRIAMGAK